MRRNGYNLEVRSTEKDRGNKDDKIQSMYCIAPSPNFS